MKIFLDNENFKYITYDKPIDKGVCGLERPDFLFDFKKFFLVLEVDEYQHSERPCECEQAKMINISQSLGMPTIFLRYNPDEYKVNGENHNPTNTKRFKILKNWMNYFSKLDKLNGFLMAKYLFYDEFDETKEDIIIITPVEEESDEIKN